MRSRRCKAVAGQPPKMWHKGRQSWRTENHTRRRESRLVAQVVCSLGMSWSGSNFTNYLLRMLMASVPPVPALNFSVLSAWVSSSRVAIRVGISTPACRNACSLQLSRVIRVLSRSTSRIGSTSSGCMRPVRSPCAKSSIVPNCGSLNSGLMESCEKRMANGFLRVISGGINTIREQRGLSHGLLGGTGLYRPHRSVPVARGAQRSAPAVLNGIINAHNILCYQSSIALRSYQKAYGPPDN